LCESEQQLLDLIRDLNFGRIEHLQFRNGKPVVQPLPRIIAAVKMAGQVSPPDSEVRTGSCLKRSVIDLFALMRKVGEGEFLVVDVRHGLPFSVEIEWRGKR
jgi:hypothetical protein